MASFISISFLPPFSSLHRSLPCRTRLLMLPAKCLSSGPSREPETTTSSSSSVSSSISTYRWCAGIRGVGFVETAYLSYLKLTDSDALCPIAGGSCGVVLNSDYAVVLALIFVSNAVPALGKVLGVRVRRDTKGGGYTAVYGELGYCYSRHLIWFYSAWIIEMFGSEAVKKLAYVECFPDGYRKGTKIALACADAKLEVFPTWTINGWVFSGELELSDLAEISGFSEFSQPS